MVKFKEERSCLGNPGLSCAAAVCHVWWSILHCCELVFHWSSLDWLLSECMRNECIHMAKKELQDIRVTVRHWFTINYNTLNIWIIIKKTYCLYKMECLPKVVVEKATLNPLWSASIAQALCSWVHSDIAESHCFSMDRLVLIASVMLGRLTPHSSARWYQLVIKHMNKHTLKSNVSAAGTLNK